MGLRLRGSTPKVSDAGNDLVSSLNDLVAATGRWLALQPVAQELPVYAERAMALGQLGAIGPVDQRDVRHDRYAPSERVIDLFLPCGVGQVIVAANDVGDAKVDVIDDRRQHVEVAPVPPHQHGIAEVAALKMLGTANEVDPLDAAPREQEPPVRPPPSRLQPAAVGGAQGEGGGIVDRRPPARQPSPPRAI